MQTVAKFLNKEENDAKQPSPGKVKSESLSDRDAGFCSGEDTDVDTGYHSPTETSQDSADTKDSVDTFAGGDNTSKRKIVEVKKESDLDEEPEFKKIKVESGVESSCSDSIKSDPGLQYLMREEMLIDRTKRSSPFRPWDNESPNNREFFLPPWAYQNSFLRESSQEEPLALVVDKKKRDEDLYFQPHRSPWSKSVSSSPENSVLHDSQRPYVSARILEAVQCAGVSQLMQDSSSNRCTSTSPTVSSSEDKRKSSQSNSHQRNYKNMTRERRIEANARERTRVHTISAAFETLRKCVPSYANNQKLSKLSVLRIACSYIMTLSRMAGHDYSEDQSAPSIETCIESVCNTIQSEGKTRKKKDE